MAITISSAKIGDHRPYDGDGKSALFPFDGFVRCKPKRFRTKQSNAGNDLLVTTLVSIDEDAPGTLYYQSHLNGTDKNGDDLGRQTVDLFFSTGQETKETWAQKVAAGAEIDVEAMLNEAIAQGMIVYAEVKAEQYKGDWSSKVQNVVPKSVYDKKVSDNLHRVPRHGGQPNGAAKPMSDAEASAAVGGVLG